MARVYRFYLISNLMISKLTFQLDRRLATRRAGELTFAPRHAIHTLANLADTPARYLLICTPGGFERRFDSNRTAPIERDRPDLETHVVGPSLARRTGQPAARK